MTESEIITSVTKYADHAHDGQMRKYTPERYIVHPIRVMELVRPFRNDVAVLCAALLHDVLEDTPVTQDEIRAELCNLMESGHADRTVALVVELTDVFIRKNYPQLNRRARKEKEASRLSVVSPDAQTIKYADIIDNINDHLMEDNGFARVYLREAKRMLQGMKDGHPVLRQRAIGLVDASLCELRPAELQEGK